MQGKENNNYISNASFSSFQWLEHAAWMERQETQK